MGNLFKRLIVILVLLLMLINNSLLVVISNAVDEIQDAIEQPKINPVYELNLQKYVNYVLEDDTRGLMVQANLKFGIECEDDGEYKPLKLSGAVLNLPMINDEFPQKVEVIGNSTKATNGSDSAKDFQYAYDSDSGKLKIVSINRTDDEGNIYSEYVENARDEYTIVIYYSEACYDDKSVDRDIKFIGKVQENLADEDETQLVTEIEENYEVNSNISGLISTNIQTSGIYNGFINSNILNNTEYRTEYVENLNVDIGYKEIVDELKITSKNNFINDGNDVSEDYIVYKSTKIYKQDVLDKLGEDGYLKILDVEGNTIGEINRDTETLEDGSVEFKYEDDLTEIIIALSKPINLGTLNLQNTKQIKETMKNIQNNKIKTTYSIDAINNVKKHNEDIDNEEDTESVDSVTEIEKIKVYGLSNESIIDVKDAETRIDVNVDNTEWTNSMQNDVIFTATLVSNDSRYNLFSNPVIEIKLPEEVENVILGDTSIVYGNGLIVKNTEVIEKDSCKVIRIELDGTQSEYVLNSMISDAHILINASIFIKKDITSVETSIGTTYENKIGNIVDYEKEGKQSKNVNINIDSIIEENKMMTLSSFSMKSRETTTSNQTLPEETSSASNEISTQMMATVGNQILKDGDSVFEEQIIKYTAKITNNSDRKISNVKFVGVIPEGATYVTLLYKTDEKDSPNVEDLYNYVEDISKKEYVETFELNAHEEKEIFYEVKVNKLTNENEKSIESNFKVYNNNIEIKNYSIINKVKKADMSVELKSWITYIGDNIYLYRIKINNNKSEELKNIHAELLVPDAFEVTETESYEFNVIKENNIIKIDLDKINANELEYLDLYIKINQSKSNIYEYNINTYAVVEAKGTEKYYSNENRLAVYMKGIEVVQTSEKEGKEVQYEEEIEYDFIIKNVSNEKAFEGDLTVNIKDFLDENVEPISAEYEVITYNEETKECVKETKTENFESIIEKVDGEETPELQYYSELPIGKEIKLKLKVKAGLVDKRTVISNNISVQYNKTTKISNTIKNVLLSPNSGKDLNDDESEENNNQNSNENNNINKSEKYSIDGKAWIDLNDDGQISENEDKISNLKVSLFNVATNSIAKDEKNDEITTVTDENGLYKFNDVVKGSYLVLFEYDGNSYKLASYKKSGVSEQENSDVIEKQLQIANDLKTVAVTDTLRVNGKDINNINIGLVPKQKFDLSLNKCITNVIIEYDGKTKENSYNESKLAKVEIPAKKISKSKIIVEYQIEVKNEGDVDAYVDEIVDYKPETLEFDGSLNPNWSNSSNGKLTNSTLSGKRIKPGESKIVKLYLTKEMTSSSTGIITNVAEITKSSNASNLVDIDSVEGNKNENEDDYSEAQLIISIGTGVVTYTLLVIGLLIVLIIIRLLVKKNIICIKYVSILLILVSISAIMFVSDINISSAEDIEELIKDKVYDSDALNNGSIREINLDFSKGAYTQSDIGNKKWYQNIYIHHGATTLHNKAENLQYLYCSDGRWMCTQGDHYYTLKKGDIEVTKISGVGSAQDLSESDIKITNQIKQKPIKTGEKDDSNEAYSYVGPFKVSYNTGEFASMEVYGTINGKVKKLKETEDFYITKNKKDEIKEDVNFNNKEFYIQIETEKNIMIDKVVIKIKKTITNTEEVAYTVKEKWRCTRMSRTHSNSCTLSRMQLMVRITTGTRKITEKIYKTSAITLTTKELEGSSIEIIKVDNTELDDGTKISDKLYKYEDVVLKNNTINAGFSLNKNSEDISLEKLVGSNNVIKLDGMKFIICRVNETTKTLPLLGNVTFPTYEYITKMNGYNAPETFKSVNEMYDYWLSIRNY